MSLAENQAGLQRAMMHSTQLLEQLTTQVATVATSNQSRRHDNNLGAIKVTIERISTTDPVKAVHWFDKTLRVLASLGADLDNDPSVVAKVATHFDGAMDSWFMLRMRAAGNASGGFRGFNEMQAAFCNSYVTRHVRADAFSKFKNIRQGRDTIPEYNDKARVLKILCGTKVTEETAIDFYIDGLKVNETYKDIVKSVKDGTRFDQLLDFAAERDQENARIAAARARSYDFYGHTRAASRVRFNDGPQPMELNALEQEVDELGEYELKERVIHLESQLAAMNTSRPNGQRGLAMRTGAPPRTLTAQQLEWWNKNLCLECGGAHYARDCPKRQQRQAPH